MLSTTVFSAFGFHNFPDAFCHHIAMQDNPKAHFERKPIPIGNSDWAYVAAYDWNTFKDAKEADWET